MKDGSSLVTVLIAGIGNIFLGDDAFGSEVARKLVQRSWPPGVRVIDFGIRSLDLVYALMDQDDQRILIDATQRGHTPATLSLIEPDLDAILAPAGGLPCIDSHAMDPVQVLRSVYALGGSCERIVILGCEPEDCGGDDGRMGLSPAVQAAVEPACDMVTELVDELMKNFARSMKHA